MRAEGRPYDPRHPPHVRPGIPEPSIAAVAEPVRLGAAS
jgi:hypothetical protein